MFSKLFRRQIVQLQEKVARLEADLHAQTAINVRVNAVVKALNDELDFRKSRILFYVLYCSDLEDRLRALGQKVDRPPFPPVRKD